MRAVVAVLVLGLCLAACETKHANPQTGARKVDEISAHDGKVCPGVLPEQEVPGHGFGTDKFATSLPNLGTPDAAWVCAYDPHQAGYTPEKDAHFVWRIRGQVTPVPPAELAKVAGFLKKLSLPKGNRMCTADLGGRSVLVYRRGHDLTGVVVDNYGCGDVRLTDDPFRTPPGDAEQTGTVPGVLDAPPGLRTWLAQYTNGAR